WVRVRGATQLGFRWPFVGLSSSSDTIRCDECNRVTHNFADTKSNTRLGRAKELGKGWVVVPVLLHCSGERATRGHERRRDRVRDVFDVLPVVALAAKPPLRGLMCDEEVDFCRRASPRDDDAVAAAERHGRGRA